MMFRLRKPLDDGAGPDMVFDEWSVAGAFNRRIFEARRRPPVRFRAGSPCFQHPS